MDWRDYFPYEYSRKIQSESLDILFEEWDNYDVFVIQAPTGYGKTSIAQTLLRAFKNASYITPTNQLVTQCIEEFPDTPTLSRLDSYWCDEWRRPCPATRGRLKKFCKGCSCSVALAKAKHRKGPGVYNYHTYTSHKLYRNLLIVDEAQNLERFLQERESVRLWRHDINYPHNAWNREILTKWFEALPKEKRRLKKFAALGDALLAKYPTHVIEVTEAEFNGKGTIRGQPEMRPCIQLRPVDVSGAPPYFWPPGLVRKLVLLSATISAKDVQSLGLDGRRVAYIECKSPIPAENRPVHLIDLIPVNRGNLEEASEKVAQFVEETRLSHPGENGLVHVSYQMSRVMEKYLTAPEYMFHTSGNRTAVYNQFLQSKPGTAVLVACGMQEGLDLEGDLARWQVIGKVPWPSLGDPAIKWKAEHDPDWFAWEALRLVIQACGRISRNPEDYGITYIVDNSFERLYSDYYHLFPEWFKEAIVLPT